MARAPRSSVHALPAAARRRTSPGDPATLHDLQLQASLRSQRPALLQERAKRSYEALLDAATRLFARDGYDAVGTPEIAAEAGVSVGTCYRYFDDKKQVFLEVMRRYLLNAYHETLDRLTPERFVGKARHETIEETVGVLFEYVNRSPGLNRVLIERSLRDADLAELRTSFEVAACHRLMRLIAAICPRDVVPDPEATAWMLQAAALECASDVGGSRQALIDLPRARRALIMMIERTLFPGG